MAAAARGGPQESPAWAQRVAGTLAYLAAGIASAALFTAGPSPENRARLKPKWPSRSLARRICGCTASQAAVAAAADVSRLGGLRRRAAPARGRRWTRGLTCGASSKAGQLANRFGNRKQARKLTAATVEAHARRAGTHQDCWAHASDDRTRLLVRAAPKTTPVFFMFFIIQLKKIRDKFELWYFYSRFIQVNRAVISVKNTKF